jgi:nucleotide-binding universal stress UspA family protein
MFKKILVPLDGSEMAEKIVPQVTELAKTINAQVVLLHVFYAPVTAIAAHMPSKVEEKAEAAEINQCAGYLGEIGKRFEAKGVPFEVQCVKGLPAREIVAFAAEKKMDLIAMATHGKGEVAWMLGSTAEKVVTNATVPVLLFRVFQPKVPLLKADVPPMP